MEFKEWNPRAAADSAIQTKVNGLWNHYFYGGSMVKLYHADGTGANAYIYDTDTRNLDVRSEVILYGMMITVQMNKKTKFDALWNWVKSNMQHSGTSKWACYFAWNCNM
jgi:oligosaccharide reducing-end xylanase